MTPLVENIIANLSAVVLAVPSSATLLRKYDSSERSVNTHEIPALPNCGDPFCTLLASPRKCGSKGSGRGANRTTDSRGTRRSFTTPPNSAGNNRFGRHGRAVGADLCSQFRGHQHQRQR